jgi:hypothetical protein
MNCEGLSYPTWIEAFAASKCSVIISRLASCGTQLPHHICGTLPKIAFEFTTEKVQRRQMMSAMKRLIAYYSRAGINIVGGIVVNLPAGNTEVAAKMIQQLTGIEGIRMQYVIGCFMVKNA